MKIIAPAKINLCLDILGKDKSGFHELQTVFYEYKKLADEIEIYETQQSDNVEIVNGLCRACPCIPAQKNLAYLAMQTLKKELGIKKNVSVKIVKNIPIAGGLGGASSDAAAVLKGLNKLWKLDLSNDELIRLGAALGMDVPFFIIGGVASGEHFGEKITPLKEIKGINFSVIPACLQGTGMTKTKSMYSLLDLSKCGKNIGKTKFLLEGIKKGDNELILESLHNDFSQLYSLKKEEHLSGAGPSIFTANQIF